MAVGGYGSDLVWFSPLRGQLPNDVAIYIAQKPSDLPGKWEGGGTKVRLCCTYFTDTLIVPIYTCTWVYVGKSLKEREGEDEPKLDHRTNLCEAATLSFPRLSVN